MPIDVETEGPPQGLRSCLVTPCSKINDTHCWSTFGLLGEGGGVTAPTYSLSVHLLQQSRLLKGSHWLKSHHTPF